jgi:multidrug efflux pump subunit AcrB
MGKVFKVIPLIVIPTLLFSLIESMFILPAHLSHYRAPKEGHRPNVVFRAWGAFQGFFSHGLEKFIRLAYRPSLAFGLRWRYFTIAWGIATLIVTVGLVLGGYIQFTFFPKVEADNVVALLTMPQGTPVEVTAEAIRQLEESAEKVLREFEAGREDDGRIHRHVLTSIGEQPFLATQHRGPAGSMPIWVGSNLGEVNIELAPSVERVGVTSVEVGQRWREVTGSIPDAVELAFSTSLFSSGEAINVQLTGHDTDLLRRAAAEVKEKLGEYPGVFDITDSFREGKQEVKLQIRPSAETLGLGLADLARQVRQGFYGEEAQRIQRGRDDIKVMVRYPSDERRSLGDLEEMRIRTPGGDEVPFATVAMAEPGRGYASIRRADRKRAINVTADVDATKGNASRIQADLGREVLPGILARYPGVSYTFEGEGRERRETLEGIARSYVLLVLPLIYALMAIPFKSYLQPLLVMTAIPFGLVGAVWGHVIMGLDLTILSLFGLVALSGVVVNDSLVLVDFINRRRREGMAVYDAVREAGVIRFRPILLTSLTTFAGISPLLLEQSVQARFLVPMAVSLGFGVIFSTFITLVLIPAGYLILEDLRAVGHSLLKMGTDSNS